MLRSLFGDKDNNIIRYSQICEHLFLYLMRFSIFYKKTQPVIQLIASLTDIQDAYNELEAEDERKDFFLAA